MLHPKVYSQHFGGGVGYAGQSDDYLYDFMVQDGHPVWLIKRLYDQYSTKIYGSLLHGQNFIKNLGTDLYGLKFAQDQYNNIYVTGIFSKEVISDSTKLFVCKYDSKGNKIWTNNYTETERPQDIFIDDSGDIFVHNTNYLFKIDKNGQLLWKKPHPGEMKFYNNNFYTIRPNEIFGTSSSSEYCNSMSLVVTDTSGQTSYEKIINAGLDSTTLISSNFSFNLIDNKIIISNNFWGRINIDPDNSNISYDNSDYAYINEKWGYVLTFRSYLVTYDTLGNLQFASPNAQIPYFDYSCVDSAGSIYFAGSAGQFNFGLVESDSLMGKKNTGDVSYIVKYTKDLKICWYRNIDGLIKYLGISHYSVGGEEKLDIAGEYEGNIHLDLEYPKSITFVSEGKDLFFASYYNLNDNLSPTDFKNIENTQNIYIYPNPNRGLLHIKVPVQGILKVEIYNTVGQLQISQEFETFSDTKNLDISDLKDGCYIAQFITQNQVITQKFILSK